MKLFNNAWLWFGVFCVGLFFVVQMLLGVCVDWAVKTSTLPDVDVTANAIAAPNCNDAGLVCVAVGEGASLVELWERESWAVQQTKKVLVSDSKPSEQILILETPQLSPGLELVQ